MKSKIYVLASLIFTALTASAQDGQGEMTYVVKMDMHASLDDSPNSEMIKQMIPQYQETEKTLLYTKTATIFQNEVNDDVDEKEFTQSDGDSQVKIEIQMGSEEEIIFTNLENNVVTETRDLMGKVFLIKHELNSSEWKISEESKVILGMNCIKAVSSDTSNAMEVWFTPEIPISSGPNGLGGLPGLILEANMDDGVYTIMALKNEQRKIKKSELSAPTRGKKVTEEEFEAIAEEKMNQMREQHGGSGEGNMIIIGGE